MAVNGLWQSRDVVLFDNGVEDQEAHQYVQSLRANNLDSWDVCTLTSHDDDSKW